MTRPRPPGPGWRTQAFWFRLHRWAAFGVAAQALAWILGGALFAWLPFQAWVKRTPVIAKPVQTLPAQWQGALQGAAQAPGELGPLLSLSTFPAAGGPLARLRFEHGERVVRLDGTGLAPPDAAGIGRFAQSLYTGDGALVEVARLPAVPRRLGLVRELGDRQDVWLARFNDRLKTRLYFDGPTGEFLTVRSEAWVLYDFFWRLHVMDYRQGEDFNNPWLRAASLAALALVGTGLILTIRAVRRGFLRNRQNDR